LRSGFRNIRCLVEAIAEQQKPSDVNPPRAARSCDSAGVSRRRAFLTGAAALAAVAAGTEPWGTGSLTESGAAHAAVLPRGVGEGPLLAAVSDDDDDTVVKLFEDATASVVAIMNVEVNGGSRGKGGAAEEAVEGIGSGFVWDEFGHIVTNYHVVAKLATDTSGRQACRVSLLTPSGAMQTYSATLVGTDPSRDLAVLKVDLLQPVPAAPDTTAADGAVELAAAPPAPPLYPIPIGSSSDLRVGQSCFAIGNPYGLQHTLTAGVISGLGREIPAPTGAAIRGAIQTDAAINSGNSGGPLLDSFGRIIGVNTATFTRSGSGSSSGVNFAIPVDTVRRVVPRLIVYGSPRPPAA
ncbi:hypothetical protein CLOP_g21051, partial [Closterium sp. NIES-67]